MQSLVLVDTAYFLESIFVSIKQCHLLEVRRLAQDALPAADFENVTLGE